MSAKTWTFEKPVLSSDEEINNNDDARTVNYIYTQRNPHIRVVSHLFKAHSQRDMKKKVELVFAIF